MPKRVCAGVLIVIFLLATAVMAQQGPQGRWWKDPQTAKKLNLTQGEINRLESAWQKSRTKMIKLKSEVESEQFRLQTLLEKPKLDEKAVRNQNRKLENARSKLADERTLFVVKVRKIIGHERFQRLASMR
jgi:Spy/CpxP family protein refolding chaperone